MTDHRPESGSQLPAPTRRYSLRIGPARRRAFLRALAETGSFVAAARAASPHCKHPLGPASSFRQLMKRSPEFADQVRAAEDEATAKLEKIEMERACLGVERPVVFSRGPEACPGGRPRYVETWPRRSRRRFRSAPGGL